MKNVIYIIVFSFWFPIYMFSQHTTLNIIQKRCEKHGWDNRERNIKVYNEDNSIIEYVKTDYENIILRNLEFGNYRIIYKNIFGQDVEQNFKVDLNTKEIEICIDKFNETNEVTLFSQLKESDVFELNYISMGCFNEEEEKWIFYSKNTKWYVDFFIDNEKIKSKKISTDNWVALIEFEKRVRQMENSMGGCTTTNDYKFDLNGKRVLHITDESCDWGGYYKIRNIFFK